MSGTSYSIAAPGVSGVATTVDRKDRLHALDEDVRFAFVEVALLREVAHDANGLHQRLGVIEDRLVIEAQKLPSGSRFGV